MAETSDRPGVSKAHETHSRHVAPTPKSQNFRIAGTRSEQRAHSGFKSQTYTEEVAASSWANLSE